MIPERSLRADEQVLEVVAGVVLAEFRERVDDPPIGEHDLDPDRQFPRVAEGEHRGAARVSGEIAADRAGAF